MRKMGEKLLNSLDEISVVDVYDLASDIGKECEKIIEIFGAEAVTSLMPKVINALELLEGLASRNENENETIQMLTDRIAYLENEMQEKAVFRERLQKVCVEHFIEFLFFNSLQRCHRVGVYKRMTTRPNKFL